MSERHESRRRSSRADAIHRQRGTKQVPNSRVPIYWEQGVAAHNSTGSFWTDGQSIYSYGLRIGETLEDGIKVVYNFTRSPLRGAAPYPYIISATTSQHVHLAAMAAPKVISPAGENYI